MALMALPGKATTVAKETVTCLGAGDPIKGIAAGGTDQVLRDADVPSHTHRSQTFKRFHNLIVGRE